MQKIGEIWLIRKYNHKKNLAVDTDPEIKDVTNKDIKIANINMFYIFKKIWGIMTMMRIWKI